ncbi:MAG TPA: C39 family peptidase [Chloroflexota bacterium]|nr:C39 family peptidase [Chloroflexota bacterium]
MAPRNVLTAIVLLLALLARTAQPVDVTRAETPVPAASHGGVQATLPRQARLTGYPQLHQQHALSCEAAVASMATGGRISEDQILARMPHNANPWLGFRGNVDGGQSLADGLANYGIYAPPLAHELQGFGYQTVVITGPTAPALLRYSIGVLRRPVEVWVTHYLGPWPAITGHADGRSFTLIDGEHARLAIGYDAGGIYTLDPLAGPQYDAWATFLASWARFDYMGVVVATVLPRPPAPAIHMQHRPGTVTWSWTSAAAPLASEVTLFRGGRPSWQVLLTPAPQSAHTAVLSATVVLTGTVLATLPISTTATIPISATAPASTIYSPGSLFSASTWYTGPLTLQVQMAPSVPYSLTVRELDPLGLTSPLAASPVALDAAAPPVRRATAPPPVPPAAPVGIRAAIVGPRLVRWTWPMRPGLTYRVVSYRYLGSRPIDYMDLTFGQVGSFTRTVQQDMTYYAQIVAINGAGLSSPATPPSPAPIIASARFLGPVEGSLQHGGYGVWRWTAHGATRFLVQSYAYAGPQVVAAQQLSTTGATYRRRLTPGLSYYVMVRAVANDGEQTAQATAQTGLVYYPSHNVQQLQVRRLAGGWQRWTWAAQRGVRYRLQLVRYAGRHAKLLARVEIDQARWTSPPAPPNTTDYLQVWSIDACGDLSGPVGQRGIAGPRATG